MKPAGLPPALVAGGAVLAAGTGYWHLAGPLVLADPRVTIYQLAFLGTLAVAMVAAVRAKEPRALAVALILSAGWALHQVVHSAGTHPLSLHGAINLGMAVAVTMLARERWEAMVALILLAILALGALTHAGLVPSAAQRPRGAFLAWSYPDLAAVLGHLANLVTGVAADGGRRARSSRGHGGDAAGGVADRVPWLRRPVGVGGLGHGIRIALALGPAPRRRDS